MNLLHFFQRKKISVESIVIVVECIFLVKLRIVCFLAKVQTDSYTRSWLVQCAMFHSLCPHFNFNCNKGEKTNCWAWVQLHFMSQFLCAKRNNTSTETLTSLLTLLFACTQSPTKWFAQLHFSYLFTLCALHSGAWRTALSLLAHQNYDLFSFQEINVCCVLFFA